MQIAVYKSSGGRDIVSSGNFSPEASAKILFVLTKLRENGIDDFYVRSVNKSVSPKLLEIKHGSIRFFFFLHSGKIHITHITEHKQKNKTERYEKATATQRISTMLNTPSEHIAWI